MWLDFSVVALKSTSTGKSSVVFLKHTACEGTVQATDGSIAAFCLPLGPESQTPKDRLAPEVCVGDGMCTGCSSLFHWPNSHCQVTLALGATSLCLPLSKQHSANTPLMHRNSHSHSLRVMAHACKASAGGSCRPPDLVAGSGTHRCSAF